MAKSMRFLLVDADRDRVVLRYLIDSLPGYTIDGVGSIADAKSTLLRNEPYDAILLGLHLPNGAGENAFLQVYRAVDGVVPIVILSDRRRDTDSEVRRLVAIGAAGYLWRSEASSRQICATLVAAAEHAQHSARLTTTERDISVASTKAVGRLRRASSAPAGDPDFPAALAEFHRVQDLTQRQLLATVASLRDEQHALREELQRQRARDREHQSAIDDLEDTAERDMRRIRQQLQATTDLIDQHQAELAEVRREAARRLEELEAAATANARRTRVKTLGLAAPGFSIVGILIKMLWELLAQ
jgi:DNA-binding NarL/FixJ family response regulator